MIPDDVVRRRIALPETGVEIAVQDWGGDGPLALFHHANGFCAAMWAPIAEPLRTRFRIVAMDARGAGDSPNPPGHPSVAAYSWAEMAHDVHHLGDALLAETGEQQIALGVGHSFGGTLVMSAEAERPGLFGRIVAIDPVTPPPPALQASVGASRAPQLAEMARRRRSVWPSRQAAREHFASRELFGKWTERALALYVAEGLCDRSDGQVELRCSPDAEAGVFAGHGDFDVFATVAGLAPPVLLLWAMHGNFPRQAYERLASTMANARIEDVDAGHLVPMETPERVLEWINRFVVER